MNHIPATPRPGWYYSGYRPQQEDIPRSLRSDQDAQERISTGS
jgi:hypothetical protein